MSLRDRRAMFYTVCGMAAMFCGSIFLIPVALQFYLRFSCGCGTAFFNAHLPRIAFMTTNFVVGTGMGAVLILRGGWLLGGARSKKMRLTRARNTAMVKLGLTPFAIAGGALFNMVCGNFLYAGSDPSRFLSVSLNLGLCALSAGFTCFGLWGMWSGARSLADAYHSFSAPFIEPLAALNRLSAAEIKGPGILRFLSAWRVGDLQKIWLERVRTALEAVRKERNGELQDNARRSAEEKNLYYDTELRRLALQFPESSSAYRRIARMFRKNASLASKRELLEYVRIQLALMQNPPPKMSKGPHSPHAELPPPDPVKSEVAPRQPPEKTGIVERRLHAELNRVFRVEGMLADTPDPQMAKQILIALLSLGRREGIFNKRYRAPEQIQQKVIRLYRDVLHAEFSAPVYRAVLSNLVNRGIIHTTHKDVDKYSLSANSKDAADEKARQVIRYVTRFHHEFMKNGLDSGGNNMADTA